MDEQEVAVGQASFDIGTDEIEVTGQIGIREAPGGWQIVRLAEVAGIRYGLGQPPTFESTGIPMIRATDIKGGSIISKTVMRVRQDAIPTSRNAFLTAGDIIVVRSGAYTGDVAMYDGRWNEAIVGYDLVVSPAREIMDPAFLAEYLLGPMAQRYFMSQRGRSAQPHLNAQQLGNTLIPVPPIFEQRAIAAVLQAIRAAIQVRRREENLERERKAALMHHLFTYGTRGEPTKQTELGVIPESWRVVPLGQVVSGTQYGLSLPGEAIGPYPILRMNNLDNGKVDTRSLQYVTLDATTLPKFRLNAGDILFNRTNSYDLVGKTALFNLSGDYVFASYLIRVVANRALLLPSYLNAYLNWGHAQQRLKMLASRGVSQSNISASKLADFSIPLPSMDEQASISEAVTACDAKITALEQETRRLEELFRALLEELITGRLSAVPLVPVEVAHE